MRDISKNIRSLREEKKLTQDQLAEMLFVTRQTVSNYETGRSRPDIEMLTKIAEALEVDANTVIYGVAPTPEQRVERNTLIAAFLMNLALGIIWLVFEPLAQEYKVKYYHVAPQLLLHIFVLPGLLIMFGWTLMQGFHVFLGTRRLKGKNVSFFRCILLSILALWVVLVLPPMVDMLRLEIIHWQWMQSHSYFSSTDFELPGIWQKLVWNPVSTGLLWFILKYCWVFPVLGITLWLTDFPKLKKRVTN